MGSASVRRHGLTQRTKFTVGVIPRMGRKRNRPDNSAKVKPKMPVSKLTPNRSVLKIDRNGLFSLGMGSVSPESVGWKAYGQSALPSEWVPTFVVIDDTAASCNDYDLQVWIADALASATVCSERVIVRSSGASETMRNRGRLVSEPCSREQIISTIRRLSGTVADQAIGKMHWIVQTYSLPALRGHLSNERHLSHEHRDWIAEIEGQGERKGYTSNIGIRPWRDGIELTDLDLSCGSEAMVTLRLRKVAKWATASRSRVHFEWVWDGTKVWLVQADVAEAEPGFELNSLKPSDIPVITPSELSVFVVADDQHFNSYGKLRNAKIYSELGYQMPQYYVLDDLAILKNVLEGRMPSALERDLRELTKRPLIIRTDGKDIPVEKREMLPRSDELRSADEAKAWLLSMFKPCVETSALKSAALCLIAHHFIPSVASAWARAEPGKGMVRMESLWGLPEGLYWYSHDTFEVDTQQGVPYSSTGRDYPLWKRLRYKGTLIAPDPKGRWVPFHTGEPNDWRRSIRFAKWIFEIASTTRRIADIEGYPVAVMWFIDNDSRATKHKVLPWYHCKSRLEGPLKAAPRKKLAIARDHTIEKRSDWEVIKQNVLAGVRCERIIIKPTDPDLIRNREFTEELAKFASDHKIVVELAGGVLSHAYYVLQRAGAQVECVNLFGADEDIVEYNKVVRDRIPELIEGRGERVEVVHLRGDALLAGLRQKLVEEAYESLDANGGEEIVAELADVQEVLNAIMGALGIDKNRVERERVEKLKWRGGFDGGFMLRKTSTPHSLSASVTQPKDQGLSILPKVELQQVIANPIEIPATGPYRRPDLRSVGQQTEKLFTFETEVNRVGKAMETTAFDLPLGGNDARAFTLSIEFTRKGAVIRGSVRLRLQPKQMRFVVPEAQLKLDVGGDK